jgi:hypothetical protein
MVTEVMKSFSEALHRELCLEDRAGHGIGLGCHHGMCSTFGAISALVDKQMLINDLQDRVKTWVIDCLGMTALLDKKERVTRILEEALELFQATGLSKSAATEMIDYVFDRPQGEIMQEAAGLGTCLLAWAAAHGVSLGDLIIVELSHIELPNIMKQIREKNVAKKQAGVGGGYDGSDGKKL